MKIATWIVKTTALYFIGSAATTAGMIAGLAVVTPCVDVIQEKSEKFFSRFKDKKEAE